MLVVVNVVMIVYVVFVECYVVNVHGMFVNVAWNVRDRVECYAGGTYPER